MLRRRIVVPAFSFAGLPAVEVMKRYTQSNGRVSSKISYLSPDFQALQLTWLHASSPQESETLSTTLLNNNNKKTLSEMKMKTPSLADAAKLETILNSSTVAEKVSAVAARFIEKTNFHYGDLFQNSTVKFHRGALRQTSICRMPVLSGPSLDTRIKDVVKVDDSIAAKSLTEVVRLLIDPQAEGVENVSLSDFAAMQPRRQLAALGGKRLWHEWLLDSAHYKQVARLELESPFYDLQALQQAGITTLYQWAEQPDLVKVSSSTRSLLDSAVEKSVESYVAEVTKVVNTSKELEDILVSWAADTVGKFVLDTLRITVEQAAAQREANSPNDIKEINKKTIPEQAAIAAMDNDYSYSTTSAGEVCTLEHYHRLARKVLSSVRKEYIAQRNLDHNGGEGSTKVQLDSQAEAEIREKAYTTLSDAMLKVLETQAPNMPKELHQLRDNGFLALERLPGLLRRATSALQLQNIPVRYFVFHSTGEREIDELDKQESSLFPSNNSDIQNSSGNNSSMNVTAPTLASGVFLTGTANYNITLGEWSGNPQPPPSPETNSSDPVQNEYFSVLHRLKRHTTRVARTTLFETIKGANEFRNGFNAAEALGLQQLLGTAKLVEDRLISVLNCYYNSSSTAKPVHFIEAGHSCGKTSLLERLSKRMKDNGKNAVIVRYSGAATPFTPGLDDHPLAFPARFWFRVALASCPYLVRTEELFTRAPKSIMWWANRLNWSWELYQKHIQNPGGHRDGVNTSLHAILVDDMDRVLDAIDNRISINNNNNINNAMINVNTGLNGSPLVNSIGDKEGEIIDKNSITHNNNNHNQNSGDISYFSPSHMIRLKNQLNLNSDMAEAALAKVTLAVGQLDMVFTGHRVSKFFLARADAPVRRYFIPLANGIGLQQRLRVFPLVSVLYALHQRSRLEFSGLMYEVLKNCPGLLGYTLDVFWSGRAALMDLRGGAPRLMQWSGTHPLLRSYVPTELFAELPQRNYLLQNPSEARFRLVELLQRQLSSPTGCLTTGVDTTIQDERDGLIVPYNHTTSQVHPFALFTIFTHQDPLESPPEAMVVRAWGEVWAEYCATVKTMATTNERKRDALRVLLHGALLLRVVAVSGAQMDLNLKIPPYGFPLLASPTRTKQKGGAEPMITKANPDTVRKAISAYKNFFSTTEQTHFPFRPSLGLNGGCDVVSFSGTTLALYDIVTTSEALHDISYRFAEALLGVLHCLTKHVLPQNKIRQIHYVSVVSIDQTSSTGSGSSYYSNNINNTSTTTTVGAGGVSTLSNITDDVFASPPTPVIPYFLDLSAVFEDDVIDRLRALQETLGINKEFRTLNDFLDELESVHQVLVHQDVVASQAELESLLSTTLIQLVPDATALPPPAAHLVSPDALLMDLLEEEISEEEEILITGGNNNNNNNIRGPLRGAEVEDVRGVAAPETYADAEHVQESAELLEAMLNDALINPQESTAAAQATRASAQAAILTDMATEDAINNNVMAADTSVIGGAGNNNNNNNNGNSMGGARGASEDALAWLHDIITPSLSTTDQRDNKWNNNNDINNNNNNVTLTTTLSGTSSRVPAGAFVSLSSDEDDNENDGFLETNNYNDQIDDEEEEERVETYPKASSNDKTKQQQRGVGRRGQTKSNKNKSSKKKNPLASSSSQASMTPAGKKKTNNNLTSTHSTSAQSKKKTLAMKKRGRKPPQASASSSKKGKKK